MNPSGWKRQGYKNSLHSLPLEKCKMNFHPTYTQVQHHLPLWWICCFSIQCQGGWVLQLGFATAPVWSWNLRASTLYMWRGGVSETTQPFKATGTKLVAESQRYHSRHTMTSFLVKNSPHRLFPLPTPGQVSFCSGRPCMDHDLAGTRVIVQNMLWIIHELEPAVHQAGLSPSESKRAQDGVTSHTLGSLYRMTWRCVLPFGAANPLRALGDDISQFAYFSPSGSRNWILMTLFQQRH